MSKKRKPSKDYILSVYRALDEDGISTERLLQMVADTCQCEVSVVVDALAD
jgi:hypothetical protein